MSRLACTLAVLLPTSAFAIPPDFGRGGLVFSLQYGYGMWNLDQPCLARQVGDDHANLFVGQAKDTHTAALRLGYSVLGYGTIGVDFTATGWNVFDASRGGAGFLLGILQFTPLEIFLKQKVRPFDAGVVVGLGYGIAGQDRGMDGLVWEVGVNAEYYFAPAFFVGFVARWHFLLWRSFYIDFDNRSQPGNTIDLPEGAGGNFFHIGAQVGFRFMT